MYFKRSFRSVHNRNCSTVTVEAAFIIPLLIFIMIAMIFIIFRLYNMLKLESDADLIYMRTERVLMEGREPDAAEVRSMLNDGLGSYMAAKTEDPDASADNGEINISASLGMTDPGYGPVAELLGKSVKISYSRRGEYLDRTSIVRKSRAGKELAKEAGLG